MTLGEKLKQSQDKANAEKIEAESRIRREKEDRIKMQVAAATYLFDTIKESLFNQISNGVAEPAFKIEDFDKRTLVRKSLAGRSQLSDSLIDQAFGKMLLEFSKEGLEFYITDEHDGVGIRSWISARCKPLKT